MGKYFEEFNVGEKTVTEKRTITEADIMQFASLTGDDNRIHTDPEFSKTTPFGKQIAHGVLGLSYALGLAWKTGMLDGTVIAFREINEWKFVKPFLIGDTVHAVLSIAEMKALPRIGGGSLIAHVEVRNQNDEICQRGSLNLLVLSKPK